jgi:hypothetical protein
MTGFDSSCGDDHKSVVNARQPAQRSTRQFKGDSYTSEQAVSGMHRTPLRNSTQQINGGQRLRVAYFYHDVKYLAAPADVNMALAVAVRRCEIHRANDGHNQLLWYGSSATSSK